MTAEEDTSYTKLPIEERCVHKVTIYFFVLIYIILYATNFFYCLNTTNYQVKITNIYHYP